MKAKISDDSIESAFSFNTISNGQTTKRDPNKIVYLGSWDGIQRQLDRVIKEENLSRRTSDNKPNTTWPPSDVDPDKWLPMDTKSIEKLFELDNQFKKIKTERRENWDWLKPQDSYNYNHFVTSIPKHYDTQFENIDFKPYMPTPAPAPSARSGAFVFRALGGAVGLILVLILLANVCKKKAIRTHRRVVLAPRAAARAGTVQPAIETHRRPSGRGFPPQLVICQSSDSPNLDLPPSYSECINKNVSGPPPYTDPADTAPLVHNGLVEIGFRNDEIGFKNDCVAMTTTPNDCDGRKTELVFDNGRIVARLSLDLNKETGQGTTHAHVKDRVVYVDEQATPIRR